MRKQSQIVEMFKCSGSMLNYLESNFKDKSYTLSESERECMFQSSYKEGSHFFSEEKEFGGKKYYLLKKINKVRLV